MHRDNHDFYGHPARRHIGPGVILAAVFIASILGTAWWAQSNYAAIYKAEAAAKAEAGSFRP